MPCHITDGPADNWPDDDGEDPTVDERVTEQRIREAGAGGRTTDIRERAMREIIRDLLVLAEGEDLSPEPLEHDIIKDDLLARAREIAAATTPEGE